MFVKKFDLFIDHANDRGVIQVNASDSQGRSLEPFSLIVDSEFVMAFSNLISLEQSETIAALNTEKVALLTDKTNLQTQVAQLSAQVTSLQADNAALQPWNKRWIDAGKFVARFTAPQTQKVYTSNDPVLVRGRELLNSSIEDNYQVILDDEQVTGLTGYMVMVGILTAEERIEILRDSSSDERYIPNA